MATGFWALNAFQRDVRRLAQLYDFTSSLYLAEVPRLRTLLAGAKPSDSVLTSFGTITHSVQRLYDQAKREFPDRLRSLLLMALTAHLEAFLTDLIHEIASRDLSPFADSQPLELPRGKVLSAPSISSLQELVIQGDRRRLTSGGLHEVRKYYRTRFSIDFQALNAPWSQILELHARRHLHVHSDGIADAQYVKEFPGTRASVGEILKVGHDYLLSAFQATRQFASAVAGLALKSYPVNKRRSKSLVGAPTLPLQGNERLYVLTLDVIATPRPTGHDLLALVLPPNGSFQGGPLSANTYRLLYNDRFATLLVGATEQRFRGLVGALKKTGVVVIRDVSIV